MLAAHEKWHLGNERRNFYVAQISWCNSVNQIMYQYYFFLSVSMLNQNCLDAYHQIPKNACFCDAGCCFYFFRFLTYVLFWFMDRRFEAWIVVNLLKVFNCICWSGCSVLIQTLNTMEYDETDRYSLSNDAALNQTKYRFRIHKMDSDRYPHKICQMMKDSKRKQSNWASRIKNLLFGLAKLEDMWTDQGLQ